MSAPLATASRAVRAAARELTGPPTPAPRRPRGPRPPGPHWLPWLLAGGVVALVGAILTGLAAVQLTPPVNTSLVAPTMSCGGTTPLSAAPPGGGTAPQPLPGGANPRGAPVRNPELAAPEKLEQLNEIQLRNAKAIAVAARAEGANARAIVMAFMAAMVETRLYNLASDAPGQEESLRFPNDGVSIDHGSVGMFQQQHWHGTPAERIDIATTTRLFLKGRTHPSGQHDPPGLFDKREWETRPAGEVIQEVQRSAFPGRYAEFETFAQGLLQRVAGDGSIGAAPTMVGGCGPAAYLGGTTPPPWLVAMLPGVQPDTLLVAGAVANAFPKIKVYGGVREDALPYHPSGRAVDIMTSSAFADFTSPEAVAYGQGIADLVTKNALALGVDHVIWNARIWSHGRAAEGWRDCGTPAAGCYAGPDDTAAHRDHVHVTTFGNVGRGMPAAMPAGSVGRATSPLPPQFRGSGSFGKTGPMWSSTHSGEDFSAPLGTPVFAVMDGVVAAQIPAGWNGIHVVIAHPGGVHTHYAHLSQMSVQPGTQVRAGQTIGLVGSTGNSSGPHLHLEYYPPGTAPGNVREAQDPIAFLLANGVRFG
ncbi:M23 family metallopeptidase [Mariniluteicoccus flavus]